MTSRRTFLGLSLAAPAIAIASSGTAQAQTAPRTVTDGFANLNKWEKVTVGGFSSNYEPEIATDIGRPAPALKLTGTDIYSFQRGTTVALKNLTFTNGLIELSAYIAQPSILDVFFRCNPSTLQGTFARLDGRVGSPYFDSILDVATWSYTDIATTQTELNKWHRLQIIVIDGTIVMVKNGRVVAQATNVPVLPGGQIVLMNEGGTIYVDSFRVIQFE
jgi:hypothetical protein